MLDFSPLCRCNHRQYDHVYDMSCVGRTLIKEDLVKKVALWMTCDCKKYRLNNLAYLEQKYEEKLQLK
jgi:hypothetical protein